MNNTVKPLEETLTPKIFQQQKSEFERAFRRFVQSADTGLDATLFELWNRGLQLRKPFWFDADADMAKFTFPNGRSFHICTSTRRFHRPKKTGKLQSVTIVMGGFKDDYNDPEDQLIPCDKARKFDCCYFGMAEDEVDLAIFFIEQMVKFPGNLTKVQEKAKIVSRSK